MTGQNDPQLFDYVVHQLLILYIATLNLFSLRLDVIYKAVQWSPGSWIKIDRKLVIPNPITQYSILAMVFQLQIIKVNST